MSEPLLKSLDAFLTEYQKASNPKKFLGQQSEQSGPVEESTTSGFGLPTTTVVCPTGDKLPLDQLEAVAKWAGWILNDKVSSWKKKWTLPQWHDYCTETQGCDCKICKAWKETGMAYLVMSPKMAEVYKALLQSGGVYWDTETPASLAQSPVPQPTEAPQMIFRPLDLRKGGQIRLTEAEAQLAMSQEPLGALSSRFLGKSEAGFGKVGSAWKSEKWTSGKAYPINPPKTSSAPIQYCLGKPLKAITYGMLQDKKKMIESGTWNSLPKFPGTAKWSPFSEPIPFAQWLENFAQYEKAWLELQAQQQEKSAPQSTATSNGDEIPF